MNLSVLQKAIIVLVVSGISYLIAVFSYLAPPVVALEIMTDLSLNRGSLGIMFGTTMLAYALMQPIAGFCADRFGPRRCLLFATLTLGLGSLLFSQAQGLGMGMATRAMVGIAAGLTLIPCMKLAGNWFSPKYFGLVSSCIIALSAIGNGLAGRPLAALVSDFGWQTTFAAVGVVGIIWSVVVFALVNNKPKGPSFGQEPGYQPAPVKPTPGFFEVGAIILKMPAFWLLGFLYAGTDMIYCTFSALWIGPYLMEVYDQPETVVGNMITLAAVSYFIGPPLLALWGGAWTYCKVILTVAFVNLGLMIFFVTSPNVPGVWVLYILCFLSPIGAQLTGMILAMGRDLVPEHIGGSAMGFLNLFPILAGAIMQKVVGNLLVVEPASDIAISARELYGFAFTPMLVYTVITIFLVTWQLRREACAN